MELNSNASIARIAAGLCPERGSGLKRLFTLTLFTLGLAAPAPVTAAEVGVAAERITHSSTLWAKGKSAIEGRHNVIETDEGRVLEIARGLSVRQPPDPLRVILSPLVVNESDVGRLATNRNAQEGGVVLGELPIEDGRADEARFRIPAAVDLDRYRSVILYCEPYEILWGGSTLADGDVVAAGDVWVRKGQRIRGGFEIARTDRGVSVRVDERFRTRSAPDLKFVLSRDRINGLGDSTALADSVIVGELDGSEGAQEVSLETDADLTRFRSLLIHCEQYTKLWGGTNVRILPPAS